MNRILISFWKTVAIILDLRPRGHIPLFPNHPDYPIASTNISDAYTYPADVRVLFEWDELGRHWIAFVRK